MCAVAKQTCCRFVGARETQAALDMRKRLSCVNFMGGNTTLQIPPFQSHSLGSERACRLQHICWYFLCACVWAQVAAAAQGRDLDEAQYHQDVMLVKCHVLLHAILLSSLESQPYHLREARMSEAHKSLLFPVDFSSVYSFGETLWGLVSAVLAGSGRTRCFAEAADAANNLAE